MHNLFARVIRLWNHQMFPGVGVKFPATLYGRAWNDNVNMAVSPKELLSSWEEGEYEVAVYTLTGTVRLKKQTTVEVE